MTQKNWRQVKEVFLDAMRQPPEERPRFLERACGGDKHLRREVESLLASFDEAENFMEKPAAPEIAGIIEVKTKKLEAGKCFGHYEIIKQIGAGGMGEVFLAKDKKLDRKVAVKILNEKFAKHESNLVRFIKEAKAASALNHPSILTIHEIGEAEGEQYIVSEYIEGKTLRQILAEKTLKLPEMLDISIQIANALAAAHAAKIVHRDVKPENIMVRSDGFVKILDFGLAKLIEQKNISIINLEESTVQQNQTAKGMILGTVNYMSPEQAKGEPVDERTDIFSLGVVVYEMIAERTPFAGDSMSETFANLINKEPQPLSRFAANVPDDLQRVVSKTLRKNKDERYQTMKGLLADLKELKETVARGEKLERTASPDDNVTKVLQPATFDFQKTAVVTQNSLLRKIKRNSFAAVALLILLAGAVGYGFWFFINRSPQIKQIESIAVLPLKSLTADENYLGLGIADALIRRISQTGKLIVRPTSAVRRYQSEETDALTAGRQLNADTVLEGSVQRADDRLRVSVNLLRTSDGVSLWTDSFDMRMTDIFTIQDTVAQQITMRLQLQLDPSQKERLTKVYTSNPVAYEFYLKGVYAFDQRVSRGKPQMEAVINFFRQAIDADPSFALAHAQLAYAYATKAVFFETTEPVWAERAKEEINRAEALDPQLAETHLARFQLLYSIYEGYQGEAAIRELLSAQKLNPNVGHAELAYLYLHLGLEDFAAREIQRASEIDPTSEFVNLLTFLLFEIGEKYDEYAAQRQLYSDPYMEAWYFMGKGRLDDAEKVIDEWSAKKPDYFELPQRKALLSALKGDFRIAEAAIPSIISNHPAKDPVYHHATYDIARIYALEGKPQEAVKWLRETADTGFPCYPLFERDAYLKRIRQAPEFIQFINEMKAQNEKYKREFASTL